MTSCPLPPSTHLLVHPSKFITFSSPLTAAKGPQRGLPWSYDVPRCFLQFLLGWQGAQQGDRRKDGTKGGGDRVVTSEAGREIEVDDERGEIKRGMLTEQKRKVKRERWGQWSGSELEVDSGSHKGMSMLDEVWTEVEGGDEKPKWVRGILIMVMVLSHPMPAWPGKENHQG